MKKWRPKEMFEIENSGGRTNLPQKWIAKKLRAYFQHLWLQSVNLTCTSFLFLHYFATPTLFP